MSQFCIITVINVGRICLQYSTTQAGRWAQTRQSKLPCRLTLTTVFHLSSSLGLCTFAFSKVYHNFQQDATRLLLHHVESLQHDDDPCLSQLEALFHGILTDVCITQYSWLTLRLSWCLCVWESFPVLKRSPGSCLTCVGGVRKDSEAAEVNQQLKWVSLTHSSVLHLSSC